MNKLRAFLVIGLIPQIAAVIQIKPPGEEIFVNITNRSKVILSCINEELVQWTRPKTEIYPIPERNESGNEKINGTTYMRNLTLRHYWNTGRYTCQSMENYSIAKSVYVYVFDDKNLLALRDEVTTLHVEKNQSPIVIPCRSTAPNWKTTLERTDSQQLQNLNKTRDGFKLKNDGKIDLQGEYRCCVERGYGNKEKQCKKIELHFDNEKDHELSNPVIRSNHSSKYFLVGTTAELHCSADIARYSYDAIQINWKLPDRNCTNRFSFHNSTYIKDKRKNITTTLIIHNLTSYDQKNYSCEISSSRNVTKMTSYFLRVHGVPEIALNHNEEYYMHDKNHTTTCSVSYYPSTTIRWFFKNCISLPFSCENKTHPFPNSTHIEQKIGDKIKSELNFTSEDSKVIICFANNSLGSSNKSSMYLATDIKGGFGITKMYTSPILIGQNVTILCAASKYHYLSNLTWYFNDDENATNIPGIEVNNFQSKFSFITKLSITKARRNHIGKYFCKAWKRSTDSESNNRSVEIGVFEKPEITVEGNWQNGIVTRLGELVRFRINATGISEPNVTWTKDGQPLEMKLNDTRIELTNKNRALTIRNVSEEDLGWYLCVASNEVGNKSMKVQLQLPSDEGTKLKIAVFFSITAMILLGSCTLWAISERFRHKRLRKDLQAVELLHFEKGDYRSINPDLGIEQQADLLPYDQKWEFPREKLKIGELLGSGAFGEVRKAKAEDAIDGNVNVTTVAVKMVKRPVDLVCIKALISELKILIHLGKHLNIVSLLGACTKNINEGELIVIFEFCRYGNLRDYLLRRRNNFVNQTNENSSAISNNYSYYTPMDGAKHRNRNENETEVKQMEITERVDGCVKDNFELGRNMADANNDEQVRTSDLVYWSYQIASGMDYLTSRKVLHGDLAARNVLLTNDNIVKICDFGLSKNLYQNEDYQKKKNLLLPIKWMAIESIRDRMFSTQSDVWSFGITMWELFSLSTIPYPGIEKMSELYDKLISGYRLERPIFAPKEIYDIMYDCWHFNPTSRPQFAELRIKLDNLLEKNTLSQYVEMNDLYVKMNGIVKTDVDYLAKMGIPQVSYTVHVNHERMYDGSPQINFKSPRQRHDQSDTDMKTHL